MPRPSRVDEAKEKLRAYYAEHGGMPSIQTFAEVMSYASPSSAHDVTNALVQQGFLAKDERGGRLLPGPLFGSKRRQATSIPAELLDALPKGVDLQVVTVPKGSPLATGGVLAGDYLVLAPANRTDLSDILMFKRGQTRRMAQTAAPGWNVAGVVVAQFRSYRK